MLMNQKASGITMEKVDVSELRHNATLGDISTMQASIATLKAHATYIDSIKNK